MQFRYMEDAIIDFTAAIYYMIILYKYDTIHLVCYDREEKANVLRIIKTMV